MEVKKCPHCGAVIEHNYNHKCPYCRNYLHITDEKIREINNCDIIIKKVIVEESMFRNSRVVTLIGISTPKFFNYEEGISSVVVSGDDLGKRVGFRFEIPFNLIYKADDKEMVDFILSSLPPVISDYRNQDFIIREIMDKIYKRRFI